MIYWAITFCIVYAILSLKISNILFNPMFIFMSVWALMLFMNSMSLLTLYKTEDKYYLYMAIGFHSYFLGYLLYKLRKRKTNIPKLWIQKNYFVYSLCILVLFLLFVKFVGLYGLVAKHGLAYLKKGLQTGELEIYSSNSIIMPMLWQFIVLPGRMVLSVIVSVNYLEMKKNKLLLILYICIIIMSVFVDGGRSIILYLLIHFVIAIYFTSKTNKGNSIKKNPYTIRINKYSSKKILSISLIVVIGLIGFYYATIARSGAKAFIHLYFYGSISPVMFQLWSKTIESQGLIGFGLASINGFISPLLYLIKMMLGASDLPFYWGEIVQAIYDTDEIWLRTSSLSKSNAYVSLFWFFYLDGRLPGIIIGMFIYGMLSNAAFSSYMIYKDKYNLCVLQLWIQGLIFSGVRLQFSVMPYAIAFMILMISFKAMKKGA